MRGLAIIQLLGLALAMPLRARAPSDPTSFAAAADVQVLVTQMSKDMKPGQIFSWKRLVQAGTSVAAVEIWRGAGKPAVHPAQAEYVVVVAGTGSMVSGGTLVDPKTTNPNLVEGSRIEGGTTRTLAPGDVFLVPAGVPHWFDVPAGGSLALLGTKLPNPAPAQ